MKITSFFPELFVKDIDKASKSYVDDFGFEIKHRHEYGDAKCYILKNEEGDRVALVTYPDDTVPEGFHAMRINVRDIDEAINYFLSHGYKNTGSILRNGVADIHGHARYEFMESPDGYFVDVVEHEKTLKP